MNLNLPEDPKDLTTDYEVKQSDLDWTKERVINTLKSGVWATSSAFFFVIQPGVKNEKGHLCVAGVFDETNLPSICIEDLARAKKVFGLLGWEFGYDKQLGITMKMNDDNKKFKYLIKESGKVIFGLEGAQLQSFIKESKKSFDELLTDSLQAPFRVFMDFAG